MVQQVKVPGEMVHLVFRGLEFSPLNSSTLDGSQQPVIAALRKLTFLVSAVSHTYVCIHMHTQITK